MMPRLAFLKTQPRILAAAGLVISIAAAVVWATSESWWTPNARAERTRRDARQHPRGHVEYAHGEHGGHDHGGGRAQHHHNQPGHAGEASIELSAHALKNIGFRSVTVELKSYERTMGIPAIVVEQPGQTQIHVVTPLTGILREIHTVTGEAIEPGSPMFQVRLTHEEVVTAQRDYLLTSESLDIVDREIARLKSMGEGVVPGKRILDQQYERQKLEAALLAGEQALLLHGLDAQQIAEIRAAKKLLQTMTIRAPDHSHVGNGCGGDHLFHVQRLSVSQGQHVEAGQELCVLADHCELLVEGRAFEDDAKVLRDAVREGWDVSATLLIGDGESEKVEGLKLLYLSDEVDPESRAFHFYLRLPNEVVMDRKSPSGHRFIEWRFKPGQRMELRIPVERWKDRIVLPAEALVEEGAEMCVYRQKGDHFDRVPVHVEYRDRNTVVVANDQTLLPGDIVAGRGAYQIHLACKNKAGGGVDPHAGHQH